MVTYEQIMAILHEGGNPSISLIDEAILHQSGLVLVWSRSFAKHAGRVMAAGRHPFPLPADEVGRTRRRSMQMEHELFKLSELFAYRELAEIAQPLVKQEGASA